MSLLPPQKNKTIPESSQWLGGIGAGSWFYLSQQRDRYKIDRFSEIGELECSNLFQVDNSSFDINKDYKFNEGEFNQLAYWMDRQIIDDYPLGLVSPVDWTDENQDIDNRVRSYLDVNCGHCHSPTGNANSTGLYLHLNETRNIHLGIYKKPVATGRGSGGFKYSIVPGKPEESILLHRMASMDPGVMMPESGRALTHEEAVEMVKEWILLMKD